MSFSQLKHTILIVLLGLGSFPALAVSPADILGRWQYDGFYYQEHRYPNPNPELVLTFSFQNDGLSILHWERNNEPGRFCERTAQFHLDGDHLIQKVIAVNPGNAGECAMDHDMQLGGETDTLISMEGQALAFHLQLNGEPFLYILKRVEF